MPDPDSLFADPTQPDLDSAVADRLRAEALRVDVEGFEGPLDLLLTLSRSQKVDLRRVSVLGLAEQYLAFVARARDLRIELAADYLVMAAWLAFLKSKLLLPPDPSEDVSAVDMAAHLAFQLERLSAMRERAGALMARDRLGRDFFARGEAEVVARVKTVSYEASLLELMQAYARIRTRDEFRPYAFDRKDIYTLEEALERLRTMLDVAVDWADIVSFMPEGWRDPARARSATAATFAASLELAKQGRVELRQRETFAPILIRARAPREAQP